MVEALHLVHITLAVSAMFALVCRLAQMSAKTSAMVRWQHGILFAGLLWSLFVPRAAAAVPVCLGVLAFLMLSARRWKHGAPQDTSRPMPLEPIEDTKPMERES